MYEGVSKCVKRPLSDNTSNNMTNSRANIVETNMWPQQGQSIVLSTLTLMSPLILGKSCGKDCLASEHFMFAHRFTHVFLSLIFNAFISL